MASGDDGVENEHDDGGSRRLTKTSFHNLKLDSSTTGTRHRTSSILKLLQSPLSQTPDIMLLTSPLIREMSCSHMGSNRCVSLRLPMQYTYITVYFTPEQARTSRHPLQLPKVSFSPHTHQATNISMLLQYIGRQLFIWRCE